MNVSSALLLCGCASTLVGLASVSPAFAGDECPYKIDVCNQPCAIQSGACFECRVVNEEKGPSHPEGNYKIAPPRTHPINPELTTTNCGNFYQGRILFDLEGNHFCSGCPLLVSVCGGPGVIICDP